MYCLCTLLTYTIGKLIYKNYQQALQNIKEGERALDVYARDLKLTPGDYERYLMEERAYLQGLKEEPAEIALQGEYVATLQVLDDAL